LCPVWITLARRICFALSTHLCEPVKPVVAPTFSAPAGYAQNVWISLWERWSDPRRDALGWVLLGDSARTVMVVTGRLRNV